MATSSVSFTAIRIRSAPTCSTSRSPRTGFAGLRGAIAWLTFPPLLATIPTGTTDVVLAAMLFGALLLWRRPAASTTVLVAAAWFKLMPVVLLPLWLARLRGRRLWYAVGCIAALSAVVLIPLLALGGAGGIGDMVHAMSYQAARSDPHSIWAVIGSVPIQQLAQAATLALIAGAAVRLRRQPLIAADRTRMAALAGAVLLGVQISVGYWAYLYLAWVLPSIALSLLGSASDGNSAEG